MLSSPLFWLFVVVGGVVTWMVWAVQKREPKEWGFKEVVKNPAYWKHSEAYREEVEASVMAAQGWSDEEIAAATRHFVLEISSIREAWSEFRILGELGDRTHPSLLKLLGDPALYERLVLPTGDNLGPEAPFDRICELLGDAPPEEAIDLLSPFLDDPSPRIRKNASLAIAKTGATQIAPLVRKAFGDSDEYVRSYALMGLEFALNRAKWAANLPDELFPDVETLLREGKNADDASNVLFRLNPERAKSFFLSAEVFQADSQILHKALEKLADAKVLIDRDRLLGLISQLDSAGNQYPQTWALGEALRLLGQHADPEDRGFLETWVDHAEARVAKGAAAGLLRSHGLEGCDQRIWETEKQSGYESLTMPQRHYRAVFMCDAEILNGGLAQYFVNPSGDQWRDAMAGFEAMGSKERLAILREAIAFFGPDGPSENHSKRQAQLSWLYKKNDAIFDGLDSRYFKSAEVTAVLLTRYVLAHPDGFR